MIRRMLVPIVIVVSCSVAGAQSVANPLYSAWVKFNQGATARYSGISRTMGVETTVETTMKLKEKAGDKVVIEVSRKVTTGGDTVEESPRLEEIKAAVAQEMGMGEVGEEETTAGGKSYKCRVFQQQRKQGDMVLAARYWLNDDVPGGVVKIDSKTEGPIAISTTIELQNFKP